jgi:hypothetical protein
MKRHHHEEQHEKKKKKGIDDESFSGTSIFLQKGNLTSILHFFHFLCFDRPFDFCLKIDILHQHKEEISFTESLQSVSSSMNNQRSDSTNIVHQGMNFFSIFHLIRASMSNFKTNERRLSTPIFHESNERLVGHWKW